MERNSLSALLSVGGKHGKYWEWSSGVYLHACVGGESQVRGCAYEWVRNKAWECPQTSLLFYPAFSSLVWRCWSVPLTKALLRRSGGAHMGRSSELEDPITEHTHGWPRRPCHTHTPKVFLPSFSLTWIDGVTHRLQSINKSTHSLTPLPAMSQRSASQLLCPKV